MLNILNKNIFSIPMKHNMFNIFSYMWFNKSVITFLVYRHFDVFFFKITKCEKDFTNNINLLILSIIMFGNEIEDLSCGFAKLLLQMCFLSRE